MTGPRRFADAGCGKQSRQGTGHASTPGIQPVPARADRHRPAGVRDRHAPAAADRRRCRCRHLECGERRHGCQGQRSARPSRAGPVTGVVSVRDLTKRYGDFAAVDGVSFDIDEGQLVAVLGPNGAGKTTTLEILEGFAEPTSGQVRVLGEDPPRGGRAWRAQVGLVLQSTSLETEPTVADLLRVFGRLYPNPRPVAEVLELIDLADDARTRVGALSGGQQRRVDLGLAIIGNPDVLFLDEPTTGLDPEARRRCWASVERLNDAGTTILLTTHYLDEADHLADRVMVLSAGRLVADTTPAAMRASGGLSVVRFPLPVGAPDLPPSLAAHVTERMLSLHTDRIEPVLADLLAWADHHRLELTTLEVGPPSLEEAYLSITHSEPHDALFASHV
ncbi:ABC transporter ATP-binding protein [Kribbella capetownensis]|uniref:ABC transporter ATP-binding protein n=1 Tax=Kribbella capetownensis TaxID=1572659 RepID=A0A4R0JQX0_9ACTN|nr:ABC transporter ATP-binding protein [Kribbella capetownensis]